MNVMEAVKAPTTEELVARAEAMIPALRERADQCERENKVPDATVADFQEAGFFKILQPKRYGGYDSKNSTYCKFL